MLIYLRFPSINAAITIKIIPDQIPIIWRLSFFSPSKKIPPNVETITSNCDNERLVAKQTLGYA